MRVVFVHGALVGDAAWWWSRMAPLLPESVAVELPSCGGGGDLYADVAAVRAALDDGPAVVCGHSYGGVVTDDPATPPEVQREQAKRAGAVVEMTCGHHPFLTPPAELAAVLRQVG
ncbi:hypothetical protein GCM10017786_51680 [Amycolatopsis deserti]|uniref:AB hydrolase-1 domain-containing protein n=1 Tax=Amycolatopsis deserti TaxID=185696 RepID=A0ABQ3JAI5_9PSEU|nr:alpha/beta hydrolase [Amycolatopsis deserti]GHF11560.1 hypothetical protein GCM10017786_51680 [Amycolatopsis deserti]